MDTEVVETVLRASALANCIRHPRPGLDGRIEGAVERPGAVARWLIERRQVARPVVRNGRRGAGQQPAGIEREFALGDGTNVWHQLLRQLVDKVADPVRPV